MCANLPSLAPPRSNRLNWPDGAESKKSLKAVQARAALLPHTFNWPGRHMLRCMCREARMHAPALLGLLRRPSPLSRPVPCLVLQRLKKLKDYLKQHCEDAVRPHLDCIAGAALGLAAWA